MITLDSLGFAIALIGLLTGMIVFLKYVSDRPTRAEMNAVIQQSIGRIEKDFVYLRTRIDKVLDQESKHNEGT